MPYLIISPLFNSTSQKLRLAAIAYGWKTLRLENSKLPEWFEIDNHEQYIIYCPAVKSFDVAKLLSVKLLCCDAYWLAKLPKEILKRNIDFSTLEEARKIKKLCFIKPTLGKFFTSGLYKQKSLSKETQNLPNNMLVYIQEPVIWIAEYRCFMLEKKVVAISSYQVDSKLFFNASHSELKEAKKFANSIFEKYDVDAPPSFVLDIGIIKNMGWAVVECNESWAAGLYSCNPSEVLRCLLKSSIPIKEFSEKLKKWDAEENFHCVFSEDFYTPNY